MTTRALLIVHEKCNKPVLEGEWVAWHREVHEPDLLATGADHVTFWQLSTKPVPGMPGLGFSHVTIVEYSTFDVPDFATALATMRAHGRIHPTHTVVDAATYAAHGAWNVKPVPSDELRGHILAMVMPNDPTREPEWDEWYDREHVPDMMASGAFSAATRWLREPRRALGADFVTLYDVSLASIDEAVTLSAAVMPGILAAGRKHPAHTGALTVTLVPA
ncbi:MAG: hypothetical protein JWM34_3619 [Ilumatobacteraceae bacterium]|nr:hypothetical protein [Ilumatobacteraceae bacterium]